MGSEPLDEVAVAIVGAGAGGLALGALLNRAGVHDFAILERSDGVGGTWRANRYPGAACDVPSRLYSLSFAPNPAWSRRFSPQPEILAYLEGIADDFGLRDRIRMNTEVRGARFDPEAGRWTLALGEGRTLRGRVLVTAVGQLSRPKVPDLAGLDTFAGTHFHSARWDPDHDLSGRSVGVIGTGASAIQIVPAIADRAERVTVFQRSPHWILPRMDRPYTAFEKRLLAAVPPVERALRATEWLSHEVRWFAFRAEDTWLAAAVRAIIRRSVRRAVADPALREALIPTDAVGCKRVLLSDDWFATMVRDDVSLVTDSIEQVRPEGIRTAGGTVHDLDTLIFATGFHATDLLAPMAIEGPRGTLDEAWAPGASAHLGITVPGFPNLFLLYGPNTNLGHNSILFMLECQAGYVVQCVRRILDRDLGALEVRAEVAARFDAEVQEALQRSVWAAGCRSWYKTASGRITVNWPWTTTRYWWRTRRPAWTDFVEQPADSR